MMSPLPEGVVMSFRPLLSALVALALALPGLRAAGLTLDESMAGWLTPGTDSHEKGEGSRPARLVCRLAVADTEAFFADPDHRMTVTGYVEITRTDGWKAKHVLENGTLRFLAPGAGPEERVLVYRGELPTAETGRVYFEGIKVMRDDPGCDAIKDMTVLAVTLRRAGHDGPVVGAGRLRFAIENPLAVGKFAASLKVHGAKGLLESLRIKARYMKLYFGTLASLYL